MEKVFGDLYRGSFKNISIYDVVEKYPDFFSGLAILLTSVDSDCAVVNHIYLKEPDISPYDSAVLIREEYVEDYLANGWPHDGFEEVYACKSSTLPQISPVKNQRFTSDGCDFESYLPSDFMQIFSSLGAMRYLSDGCHLNYVCNLDTALAIKELADAQ